MYGMKSQQVIFSMDIIKMDSNGRMHAGYESQLAVFSVQYRIDRRT